MLDSDSPGSDKMMPGRVMVLLVCGGAVIGILKLIYVSRF